MKAKFEVIGERWEEFDSKSGRKRIRRLALLDTESPRLICGLDYEIKAEDANLLPEGKSEGKIVVFGCQNFRPGFGGRMQLDAKVLEVLGNGKPDK